MSDTEKQKLETGVETLFLAGVGLMALTGEKLKETLDLLVERGEITVKQGKAVIEELRQSAKTVGSGASGLIDQLETLSKEELTQLKTRLKELDDAAEK